MSYLSYEERKLQLSGKLLLLRFPHGLYLQVRHLTYKEYLIFRSLYQANTVPSYVIDTLIAKSVVQDDVFQKDEWLAKQRAGLCKTIADLVMYLTGSNQQVEIEVFQAMLNGARHDAQSFDNIMFSTICRVFPGYKVSDLEQLAYPEIVRLFANAEKSLIDSGLIKEHFKLVDMASGQELETTTQSVVLPDDSDDFTPKERTITPPSTPKNKQRITEGAEKWFKRGEKLIINSRDAAASQMLYGNEDNMADIAAYDAWVQGFKEQFKKPDLNKALGSKQTRLNLQKLNEQLVKTVPKPPPRSVSGKVKKRGR
jgi:hypothetical protein